MRSDDRAFPVVRTRAPEPASGGRPRRRYRLRPEALADLADLAAFPVLAD